MGSESVKIKDSVSVRLYSKDGKLKQTTAKKTEPLIHKILKFLSEVLEAPS